MDGMIHGEAAAPAVPDESIVPDGHDEKEVVSAAADEEAGAGDAVDANMQQGGEETKEDDEDNSGSEDDDDDGDGDGDNGKAPYMMGGTIASPAFALLAGLFEVRTTF